MKGAQAGPTVALRADMDALPVTERVNLRSLQGKSPNTTGKGRCGCTPGDDTHVAMRWARRAFCRKRTKSRARSSSFSQPAERRRTRRRRRRRGIDGQGSVMATEDRRDFRDSRQFANRDRHYQSRQRDQVSSDWCEIKVKGKQTHGAYRGTASIDRCFRAGHQRFADDRLAPLGAHQSAGRHHGWENQRRVRRKYIHEELSMAARSARSIRICRRTSRKNQNDGGKDRRKHGRDSEVSIETKRS